MIGLIGMSTARDWTLHEFSATVCSTKLHEYPDANAVKWNRAYS